MIGLERRRRGQVKEMSGRWSKIERAKNEHDCGKHSASYIAANHGHINSVDQAHKFQANVKLISFECRKAEGSRHFGQVLNFHSDLLATVETVMKFCGEACPAAADTGGLGCRDYVYCK